MTTKQVECPRCHVVDDHGTAIKQVGSLVDVGWRCDACGYEWGFDVWKGEAP